MEQKIKCSIVRNLCKISENTRGYTVEANLVSWNDAAPKLDIRQSECRRLIPRLVI